MPASPSTARVINDRLALRLLQSEGPLTAGQLKRLTGLSRPTVADLVERLTASGLVTVVGEAGETRRGPNARLYGIVADRAHLVALDVRTEGVAVLVSDLVGEVLAEAAQPIGDDTGTGPAVEQAVALVERVLKEAGADGPHTVGIGAPGLIDPASGELRDSSGLPAWHRRLVAALQERFPAARVRVENETNLAALAEQREGAARDHDTFVLLWLGHGTGAAVVLDGTLRRGASGGTGEIGFLPVPGTAGLPRATDCDGGFHSLAGGAAIAQLAQDHGLSARPDPHGPEAAALVREAARTVATSPAPSPLTVTPGHSASGNTVATNGTSSAAALKALAAEGTSLAVAPKAPAAEGTSPAVAPKAQAVAGTSSAAAPKAPAVAGTSSAAAPKAPVIAETSSAPASPHAATPLPAVTPSPAATPPPVAAARFLDDLADRLAVGVASVAAVLDPGCVVLGGEIGQAGGEELAVRVAERVRRMSPLPTEVRPGLLGGGAVLRGALLTARDRAQDELFAPPER